MYVMPKMIMVHWRNYLSLTCPIAVPRVAGDGFQQKLMKGHLAWVWSLSGTLRGHTAKLSLATGISVRTAEVNFKTPQITAHIKLSLIIK